MKKKAKIIVVISVLLVMLANISWSFTYSVCGMTKMSRCSCGMDKNDSHQSFKKDTCCREVVKDFSNAADFTKLSSEIQKTAGESSAVILSFGNILAVNIQKPPENRLFYIPERDLSVRFSKLLI